MVTIDECTRTNFCVNCDDSDCTFAGVAEADCPKWECDNPNMDCENCEFLKEYKREVTKMSKELKPCPYRIHGERKVSLTVEGEFYYNETFMPCMGKKCCCYEESDGDAWCTRNNANAKMTKEVTE